MEVKDNTPTVREQNTNLKTDHQQKINLKVKEEKSQQSSKNEVQQQIRLEATKTANIKTEDHQLEKEKETISRYHVSRGLAWECSGVNFTNILCSRFLLISFCQKVTKTICN